MIRHKTGLGILVIMLVFGIIVVGCDGANGYRNDSENPNLENPNLENPGGVNLTGTFGRRMVSSATIHDRLIFTATTFSSMDRHGSFLSGTYRFDGAILTLTINGIRHNYYAHFRETVLTISGGGGAFLEFFGDTWTRR